MRFALLGMALVLAITATAPSNDGGYTAVCHDEYLKTASDTGEVFVIEEIPLEPQLQLSAFEACETFGVPFPLLFAVMERESDFDVSETNGTCYGLMQIHCQNFEWLEEELMSYGVSDIKNDPRDNIFAGAYMLGSYLGKYKETHKALMAYNCGEYGAKSLWEKGVFKTNYTNKVEESMKRLEKFFNEGGFHNGEKNG